MSHSLSAARSITFTLTDVTTKTKAIVWRQKNILPTPESNQEHFIPKQHILIGSILIQIPPLQEKVEPNFRTPPNKKIAMCIASPKKVMCKY